MLAHAGDTQRNSTRSHREVRGDCEEGAPQKSACQYFCNPKTGDTPESHSRGCVRAHARCGQSTLYERRSRQALSWAEGSSRSAGWACSQLARVDAGRAQHQQH